MIPPSARHSYITSDWDTPMSGWAISILLIITAKGRLFSFASSMGIPSDRLFPLRPVPPALLLRNCAYTGSLFPAGSPGLCFRKVRWGALLAACLEQAAAGQHHRHQRRAASRFRTSFHFIHPFNFSLALSFRKIQAFNGGVSIRKPLLG